MEMNMTKYRFAFVAFVCFLLLFGTAHATGKHRVQKRLKETIMRARTGKTLDIRAAAAQHLADLTREMDPKEVDDKTLSDLVSLLNVGLSQDSVRYWVARSLGNLGPRARIAAPRMLEILPEVDCIPGSVTSASAIRYALTQMGEAPPPKQCGSTN